MTGKTKDAFVANATDMARSFGLARMADNYPDDIEEAASFAQLLARRLPDDLQPVEEPAHVYRPKAGPSS